MRRPAQWMSQSVTNCLFSWLYNDGRPDGPWWVNKSWFGMHTGTYYSSDWSMCCNQNCIYRFHVKFDTFQIKLDPLLNKPDTFDIKLKNLQIKKGVFQIKQHPSWNGRINRCSTFDVVRKISLTFCLIFKSNSAIRWAHCLKFYNFFFFIEKQ